MFALGYKEIIPVTDIVMAGILRPLLVESLITVIFYVIFLMRYVIIIIILEKNFFFSIMRKQGINNCFKPPILSVFTTLVSRLNSEQKEKEK